MKRKSTNSGTLKHKMEQRKHKYSNHRHHRLNPHFGVIKISPTSLPPPTYSYSHTWIDARNLEREAQILRFWNTDITNNEMDPLPNLGGLWKWAQKPSKKPVSNRINKRGEWIEFSVRWIRGTTPITVDAVFVLTDNFQPPLATQLRKRGEQENR